MCVSWIFELLFDTFLTFQTFQNYGRIQVRIFLWKIGGKLDFPPSFQKPSPKSKQFHKHHDIFISRKSVSKQKSKETLPSRHLKLVMGRIIGFISLNQTCDFSTDAFISILHLIYTIKPSSRVSVSMPAIWVYYASASTLKKICCAMHAKKNE